MNVLDLRTTVIGALTEVAPEIDPMSIDTGAPLQDQYDLDSMDLLQFLERVSSETGIDIAERDYGSLATVDDLLEYLGSRTNVSGRGAQTPR